MFGSSLTEALEDQVTAQDAAVQKAAAMEQARVKAQKAAEREAAPAPERAPESEQAGSVTDGRGTCTTDPADRAACRNPSGTINPDGGDVDGDGVFEQNEPVGPGYKDPRAYDGGKTSGETQCEWLRSQGIAC